MQFTNLSAGCLISWKQKYIYRGVFSSDISLWHLSTAIQT